MLGRGISDPFFLIESGNMLIMTYAYARASGDGSLISRFVCRGSILLFLEEPDRL